MSSFNPADPSPEIGHFGLSRRNLFAQIGAGVGSIGMLSALGLLRELISFRRG